MPVLLATLSVVGTAAMIWVGGGIFVHGLEEFGLGAPGHAIHDAAAFAARHVPAARGLVEWLVGAAGAGLVGLALGAALLPVASRVLAPAWRGVKRLRGQSN